VDWTELCRAATAGHAADSAAFTRLVTAAGGAAQLPAFCAGVLGGDSAAPVSGSATVVLPTTPRGKHLGWCKGVGNPHHTAAQCGTGTTAGPVAGINVNGSGKTPPGWCNPHNPHYTAAGCPDATVGGGADTTDDEAGDNGND
jgi:hypothetical protein